MRRLFRNRFWMLVAAAGLAAPAHAGESPLRLSWTSTDHPSGLYLAKDKATVTVLVENLADSPQSFSGQFVIAQQKETSRPDETLSPSTRVPIVDTQIPPGRSVKLQVPIAFAGAGIYRMQWHSSTQAVDIIHPEGLELTAIFAPRGSANQPTPWLATLPRAACRTKGFIADYSARTTVRRFLLDETFLYDPVTRRIPVIGASMEASAEQLAELFGGMAQSKASLILRLTVPVTESPDAETLEALGKYIEDACKRSQNTLAALALMPATPASTPWSDELIDAYRKIYLQAYQSAKKQNKSLLMLGTGDAFLTRQLLQAQPGKRNDLFAFLDAYAITDTSLQLATFAKIAAAEKKPLWLLPPEDPATKQPGQAAIALAEGAQVIALPTPPTDRGVTAHLLGGSVLFQRVGGDSLPYVTVFQGDGYTVAAIAGLGAGTPLDALYPDLLALRPEVTALQNDGKAAYPHLEVSDDVATMRVVDAVGNPLKCRVGDMLYIPAEKKISYLLQAGTAEDLTALLRTANANRLPMFGVTLESLPEKDGQPRVAVTLRNISRFEQGGKITLALKQEDKTLPLASDTFVPITPERKLELTLPLSQALPPKADIVIEIDSGKQRQRQQFRLAAP